ncbi:MAG: hypothetical protein NTY88_09295 [Bacteroidetes bacterium]|nr:hypothetical protein [Bacteroidota bacterium]
MSKIFLTISFIIFSNVSFSQSTNDLDIKNGFRHLKLGSYVTQIKNIKKDLTAFDFGSDIESYVYIGNDIKSIFDVDIDKVSLLFLKGKLFSISASFGTVGKDFTIDEYNSLLNYLKSAYGEQCIPIRKEGATIGGEFWGGQKVALELIRRDESKRTKDPSNFRWFNGYIHVYDIKLNNAAYQNEF